MTALTKREAAVVRLLADAVPRREIARRLGCSTATVDREVQGLRERYGVATTIEVVVHAVRAGAI